MTMNIKINYDKENKRLKIFKDDELDVYYIGVTVNKISEYVKNYIDKEVIPQNERVKDWIKEIRLLMKTNFRHKDFQYCGSAISCSVSNKRKTRNGLTVCLPKSNYNKELGECIAFALAIGEKIPDYITGWEYR